MCWGVVADIVNCCLNFVFGRPKFAGPLKKRRFVVSDEYLRTDVNGLSVAASLVKYQVQGDVKNCVIPARLMWLLWLGTPELINL